jgi:hypothetical protein
MCDEEFFASGHIVHFFGPSECRSTDTGHRVTSVALRQRDSTSGTRHDGVVHTSAILQTGLPIVEFPGLAAETVLDLATRSMDSGSVSQIPQMEVHSALGIADNLENVDEDIPSLYIGHSFQLRKVGTNNDLIKVINNLFANQVFGQISPKRMRSFSRV